MELEIASRRKYEKVVVLLGYAAITVGAIAGLILGFTGYQRLSDIESTLDSKIDSAILRFNNNEGISLSDFKKRKSDMDTWIEKLKEAEEEWLENIEPFTKNLEIYDAKADLVGLYEEVMRLRRDEESWRSTATIAVIRITEHVEKTKDRDGGADVQFDPNGIFNVAQLSRHLGRADLEGRLINAAHNALKSDPAMTSLHLQAKAKRGDEDAFRELMTMVANVPMDSPHIVLAEAWIATINLGRYTTFIEAIDVLVGKHSDNESVFMPSYVLALKAEVHLARGHPGDVQLTVDAIVRAVERFQLEGPASQWADSTKASVERSAGRLAEFGADTTALTEVALSSTVPWQQELGRLLTIGHP